MQVVLVVSRMLDDTRQFVQCVAREVGLSVTLLRGDEPRETAARAMRLAVRVWFEGLGPLLDELIRAPASWKLPPACLRVGPDEVDRLPLPGLWSVVSDLVLPSPAAADQVRAAMENVAQPPPAVHCLSQPRAAELHRLSQPRAAVPQGRLHVANDIFRQIRGEVLPGETMVRLANLLVKAPGQLRLRSWEIIAAVAEACGRATDGSASQGRGRVLVCGDWPPELPDHLAQACAMDVATDKAHSRGRLCHRAGLAPAAAADAMAEIMLSQAKACHPTGEGRVDSVVFWESLVSGGPTTGLDAALARLRGGGTVVAVTPEPPAPRGKDNTAVAGLLEARLPGRSCARLHDCVLVMTGAAAPAPPQAAPPRPRRTPPPTYRGRPIQAETPPLATAVVGNSTVIPSEAGKSRNTAVPPAGMPAASPLVTAVVPVYNDAARVGRAIDSLRRQTWRDLEILVVDDGSTDETARAVAKHFDDPRVRYLYKAHSGRPETRNVGVREARGQFIAWLDSDDEALPARIQAQVDVVRADPAVDIVHTDGFIIRHDGTLRERRRYQPIAPEEFPRLLFRGLAFVCPILNTSAMVRRSLYDRVGLYDPAFPRCQDLEFYIRAAMVGDVRCAHVPRVLVKVHQAPPSAERTLPILDYYVLLARRMWNFFGLERLVDPVARDLHQDPRLTLAEVFAGMSISFRAPRSHPVSQEAEARLAEVIATGVPADCADAHTILGTMALAYGDKNLAKSHFARARGPAAWAADVSAPAAPPADGGRLPMAGALATGAGEGGGPL